MSFLRLLRPHQWSKNLLVFVSMLAGHQYTDLQVLQQTALTFLVFCLLASAGYVINDLLDVEDDRNHPQKCKRPLAAGEVGAGAAVVLAAILVALGLALAWSVNIWVLVTAMAYLLSTLAYSLWLKRKLFVDIILLAGLYTIRIIAGVAVVQAEPSFWLLAFAMFIFTGLAALKRYIELCERSAKSLVDHSVRAYKHSETPVLMAVGVANGFLSVLVLAFYLDSPEVRALYKNILPLWLLCPLLMYWTGRIWLLAGRSLVHSDPILFALKDRLSYLMGIAIIGLVLLSK